MLLKKIEAVVQSCSVEKVSMEIWLNSQENTCAKVSYLIKKLLFIKKKTLAQVFSLGFCKISKNIIFCKTLQVAAFGLLKSLPKQWNSITWGVLERITNVQKKKFFTKGFFSKSDQITFTEGYIYWRNNLLIWPHLLNKALMENFIFCVV